MVLLSRGLGAPAYLLLVLVLIAPAARAASEEVCKKSLSGSSKDETHSASAKCAGVVVDEALSGDEMRISGPDSVGGNSNSTTSDHTQETHDPGAAIPDLEGDLVTHAIPDLEEDLVTHALKEKERLLQRFSRLFQSGEVRLAVDAVAGRLVPSFVPIEPKTADASLLVPDPRMFYLPNREKRVASSGAVFQQEELGQPLLLRPGLELAQSGPHGLQVFVEAGSSGGPKNQTAKIFLDGQLIVEGGVVLGADRVHEALARLPKIVRACLGVDSLWRSRGRGSVGSGVLGVRNCCLMSWM